MGGQKQRSERRKDVMVLALKTEEGALNQGKQMASEAGKGKEMDSPLKPPEKRQPCQHLDFSPVRLLTHRAMSGKFVLF